MIKQLAHFCIHAIDLSEVEHFYVEGLGLEKTFDFIRNGELFGFYIALGGQTFVEVFKGKPADEGEGGTIRHIALEVESIDAVHERLEQHGYDIGEKRLGEDKSWQSWIEDPSGTRIELHEYTEESLQLRGGTCVVDW